MKISRVRPEFVSFIPDQLDEGVLYISDRFRVCVHKCCCGCGEEVVTPLSLAEWRIARDGNLVSLWPSVGNWDYSCRSHYWIRRNRVIEALPMTERQIARVHERDIADLTGMVAARNATNDRKVASHVISPSESEGESSRPDTGSLTMREDGVRAGAKCSATERNRSDLVREEYTNTRRKT